MIPDETLTLIVETALAAIPEKPTRLERIVCALITGCADVNQSPPHDIVTRAQLIENRIREATETPSILNPFASFGNLTPDQFPTFDHRRVIMTRRQFDNALAHAVAKYWEWRDIPIHGNDIEKMASEMAQKLAQFFAEKAQF